MTRVLVSLLLRRGVTEEQILSEWEENSRKACERGDKAHYFGERYAFDRSLEPTTLEQAISTFWEDLPDYIVHLRDRTQDVSSRISLCWYW